MMANQCVICGTEMAEGDQACNECKRSIGGDDYKQGYIDGCIATLKELSRSASDTKA
jgi:hypothetical protein